MPNKIIEKLKDFRSLRSGVKKLRRAIRQLASIHKRSPALMFYSWKVTYRKATRSSLPDKGFEGKLSGIQTRLHPHLFVYKDVLSIPLREGKEKFYSGGLVDSKTMLLIDKAVHLREKKEPSQELAIPEPFDASALPEIGHLVLYGGILYNHFGHFLLESLGRLWAYDYVKELDPFIFFNNDQGYPDYLERKNYVRQILTGFGIPLNKLLFSDTAVRFKQILVPEQKYGYVLNRNPDRLFVGFMLNFRYEKSIPKKFLDAARIYVSRSRMRFGRLVGEDLFEQYMLSQGYVITYPESHTVYEQLAIYNKAAKIVFCDGAALHACILLPKLKADIAVIARRRDPRWDCMEIIDQFLGYRQQVLWVDSVKEIYQFGLESWEALAVIDWYDVSKSLKEEGFVDLLCQVFDNMDVPGLVRKEVLGFVARIQNRPEYIQFLLNSQEPPVIVNQPSRVFNGQQVAPAPHSNFEK